MRRKGFTVVELLIVLAIIGIVGAIGFINGRTIAEGRRADASLATLQQSIWQGASAAASRGRSVELVRAGFELVLREADSGDVIRTLEMDDAIETNLPSGVALLFLPPGKVERTTLSALPDDLYLQTPDRRYGLQVSLIGEVRAEAIP